MYIFSCMFPQRQVSQIPCFSVEICTCQSTLCIHLGFVTGANLNHVILVQYSLYDLSIIIFYFAYECTHNHSIQSDLEWCEVYDIYGQSLHPLRATTFIISHFGSAK